MTPGKFEKVVYYHKPNRMHRIIQVYSIVYDRERLFYVLHIIIIKLDCIRDKNVRCIKSRSIREWWCRYKISVTRNDFAEFDYSPNDDGQRQLSKQGKQRCTGIKRNWDLLATDRVREYGNNSR